LQITVFEPGEVEALLGHVSKETKLSAITTYEKIIQKGKQEGVQEGIEEDL